MEDGGFFVPIIHKQYPNLATHTIGVVEQTSRGDWNTQSWLDENSENSLRFPVLSVAQSRIKNDWEPKYIGRAVVKHIESMLAGVALNGKTAAVLGYGAVGEQVAQELKTRGAIVTVFELSHEKLLKAKDLVSTR